MKELFLIIGAPGSGKTTDASLIAQKDENFAHFSTGDLLRLEVARKSELGNTIDSYISKGNLVPLNIVIDTIISAIKSSDKKLIIIDGYPRSIEQMTKLDEVLKEEDSIKLSKVIEVNVSQDTAKQRVLGRSRGADDNEEVFYNRMSVYLEPIGEIRKFYTAKGIYSSIDAERTIEEIVQDMIDVIKNR